MPVGDDQREFSRAAAADGIDLIPGPTVPWICQQGHLWLKDGAPEVAETLERIYVALGGDLDVLTGARRTALRGDFLHEPTRTLIEIDEVQHFTSARLMTLDLYPDGAALGFALEHYRRLCRRHREQADKYRAAKEARGFGPGGRVRQRAYYDALRDLATPAMGYPPLVRVECINRSGHATYRANREQLTAMLGNRG